MAKLLMLAGSEVVAEIELREEYLSVGRAEDTSICVEHSSLSRLHAMLVRDGDDYQIHDLASTNGTYVNGQRIMAARLKHGDLVRIGLVEFRYESVPAPAAPPSAEQIGAGVPQAKLQPAVASEQTKEKTVLVRLPAGLTPPSVPRAPTVPLGELLSPSATGHESEASPPTSAGGSASAGQRKAAGDRPLKIRLKEPPPK